MSQTPLLETEEGRAFYQERIGLAARTLFWLSFGFLVVSNLVALGFVGDYHVRNAIRSPTNQWHAFACVVCYGVGWATRRAPLTRTTLARLDALSLLALMTSYAAMGWTIPPPQHPHLVVIMIGMVAQMGRATVVPSSARATLVIGVLASIPALALAAHVGEQLAGHRDLTHGSLRTRFGLYAAVYASLWCAVTVVTATVASRVIFGLRAQVREAMRLGQYTLEAKIGEGGMGTVFRARHAMLRRPTAIKLLPPDKSSGQSLVRFEREVQLTSQLTHPNTVAIYDYGRTPDGVFYYAMEYLEGFDLQALVDATGPLPPARVVHILAQIAGALGEAHRVGLVHRDIKPANVILCERGGVRDIAKVLDFGLVKELTPAVAEDVGATGAHVVLGTPLYASPEAIRSPHEIDGRSDLYSLGALGYFLLTGTPPFEGNTVLEVCSRHLVSEPAPPSARVGHPVPTDLEGLILDCLAKDASQRPRDADALRTALEACAIPPWTPADAATAWAILATKERRSPEHVDPAYAQTIMVALSERDLAPGLASASEVA